jgi:hypothetical protein
MIERRRFPRVSNSGVGHGVAGSVALPETAAPKPRRCSIAKPGPPGATLSKPKAMLLDKRVDALRDATIHPP